MTSAVEDGFAFSWAVSPARALSEKPILHMAGAAGRCGDRTLGAAAAIVSDASGPLADENAAAWLGMSA